jgi:hypothetical protein
MSPPIPEDPHANNFRELCFRIGLALVTWQRVEDAHRKIFLRILNVPLSDVSSVVYYSTESFDARHKTLGRMAAYFLKGPGYEKQRHEWQVLQKDIKDANENRNKLAHYSADYDLINEREMPDGGFAFDVTPHTLRPARWNSVSQLLGRTKDKPEHNLGVEEIRGYIIAFRQLEERMETFHVSLDQPDGLSQSDEIG